MECIEESAVETVGLASDAYSKGPNKQIQNYGRPSKPKRRGRQASFLWTLTQDASLGIKSKDNQFLYSFLNATTLDCLVSSKHISDTTNIHVSVANAIIILSSCNRREHGPYNWIFYFEIQNLLI